MDALRSLFATLAKGAAVAALEPEKTVFRARRGHSGAITRTLRKLGHDEVADFRNPKGRDAFLLAAANYLAALEHEELLVGFGTRRGSARNAGACLRRVHRTVGGRSSVPVTPKLAQLLDAQLTLQGAETLLIHNHPSHFVKSIIGDLVVWRPMPSDADRALALRVLRPRIQHLLTAHRPSSFKWYLVDEGRVGEFLLPSFDTLLSWDERMRSCRLRGDRTRVGC